MQAVILAAGKGTRMEPLTLTMSKGMIPVANEPLLGWTMKSLDFCDEILIVVNEAQNDIIEYFSGNSKIKFIYQKEPKGTGHALLQAEPHIKGKFIAVYGDDIYGKEDIEALAKKDGIFVSTYVHEHPEYFGIYLFSGDAIIGFEEKPENPKTNIVNCGIYLFDERIFSVLKSVETSPRGEYELTDAIKILIGKGMVQEHRIKEWVPLSYAWNILDANRFLLDKYGSRIHPDAIIRPGAVIEDPVSIDAGAVIGPNCFIRKYSSVGKNCKIGQAVEIKNSIIMDNTYVSHLSYAGDSIVARNCNIGCGAIFANLRLDEKNVKVFIGGKRVDTGRRKLGGIVGDNVKFGVRVTVMPGKKVWPGLFVPAGFTAEDDISEQIPVSKHANENGP